MRATLQTRMADWSHKVDKSYFDGLKTEWAEQVRAATKNIADFTEVPALSAQRFEFTDSLKLEASVALPDGVLSPKIQLSAGTLLSIDDILLSACCHNSFFILPVDTDEAGEPQDFIEPITSKGFEADFAERYYDYGKLATDELSVAHLSYRFPTVKWRLAQASFLSSLATEWIIMHELCHWLQGHCHLCADNRYDEIHQLFDISDKGPVKTIDPDEKKCLELQADGMAFEMMFYSLYSEGAEHKWQQYNDDLAVELAEQHPGIVDFADAEQRLRALLAAAGTVIMLTERARCMSNHRSIDHYPKPITRLTNVFATAFRMIGTLLGTLIENDEGGLDICTDAYQTQQPQMQLMFSGMALGMSDIAIIAQKLDIQDAIYEGRFVDFTDIIELGQNLHFFENLQLLMANKPIPERPDTASDEVIKEFCRLLPVQQQLNRKLADVALVEV